MDGELENRGLSDRRRSRHSLRTDPVLRPDEVPPTHRRPGGSLVCAGEDSAARDRGVEAVRIVGVADEVERIAGRKARDTRVAREVIEPATCISGSPDSAVRPLRGDHDHVGASSHADHRESGQVGAAQRAPRVAAVSAANDSRQRASLVRAAHITYAGNQDRVRGEG